MSTEPTPTPADAPPDRVASFLIARRVALAYVMLALGVISAGAGVFCISKLLSTPAAAAKDADKEKDADKDKDPDAASLAPPVPYRTEYTIGVLGGVLGAVAGMGAGLWILAAPQKWTLAERATDARVAALLAGGSVGLVLMTIGLAFFVVWFPLLAKWLDEKVTPPGAWKVVTALLVFLVGAGVAFLAAQPARAEERNAPNLRRIVYGLNFALGVLLLLVVLIAGNAFAALKVPAKLDTTEAGFYSLSDATKDYLGKLTEPVKLYVTIPDAGDRRLTDARNMVAAIQAVNPQRVSVRYLSESLNRNEIAQLRSKFPSADLNEYGVLLTAGDDEKRFAFVRVDEFFTTEPDPTGRGAGQSVFRGESKLVQELLSITENTAKTVIYFTQSSNELAITSGADAADPKRAATQLKTVLEKSFAEVRPLPSGAGDAKVPDDATIVVVADPTQPLPDRQVNAIRDFVTGGPKGDGKKGKLVVLSGAHAGLDGKMIPTGLEGLLAEMSVRLSPNFLYHQPNQLAGPTTALVVANPTLVRSRNPLALFISDARVLPMDDVRLVEVPKTPAGGPFTAEPLMYTARRVTWTEPTRLPDPLGEYDRLTQLSERDAIEVSAKKQIMDTSRPVAAIVSEGTASRAVVIGAGSFFADETGRQLGGTNLQADLLGAAVNWLRDRPPVANIANKTYGVYTLSRTASDVQLFWLPVGVTLTGILALGLGMWLLRRM